jgi:hypothetical protein
MFTQVKYGRILPSSGLTFIHLCRPTMPRFLGVA